MVGEDLYWKGEAMEVVAPRFQGADDGEEFAVVDVVVALSGGEGLQEVGARVPVTVGVGLEENSTGHVFRRISGNGERGGEIREVENGFREEETFKGIEGGLAGGGPIPREVLLGEVEERASDIGVVRDEASVEIGEAKERANIFHLGWSRPACDSIEFDGVHGQLAGFNDHAKVFYLIGGELAFFEFQMEVKFGHSLQDMFGAFLMEGGVGGVDEEVVHIDDEPSFGDHVAEGVVHESLKGGRGIGKPKEHDGGFEESFMGDEGRFPLVTVFVRTLLYPHQTSNLVKTLASRSLSTRSEMRGRG